MEADGAFDPVGVRIFCANGEMTEAAFVPDLVPSVFSTELADQAAAVCLLESGSGLQPYFANVHLFTG